VSTAEQMYYAKAANQATGIYFEGMIALQKVRQGSSQTVRVEHVNVESGGQALIGPVAVRPGRRRARGGPGRRRKNER